MPRIACLWIPELAAAAVARTRPELRDAAVVVTDGRAAHSPVIATSPPAEAAGVRNGMTAAQARLVCDEVVVVPYATEVVRAAAGTLADVAATLGPRVEMTDDGTVFLDCEGSTALCASETELATILAARARRHGLDACVGIAGSKLTARIAARESGGVRVVTPADEAAYLAPLPLTFLDADAATAATLASWGITRIGELAALPASAAIHRLGPAGARIVRQARGEDDEGLRCRATPTTVVEAVALEYGVDRLEPLLFLVRRLLEQLTARLALHGLACVELEIALELESGTAVVHRVTAAAPTADAKVLLVLLRAHVEQHPPEAAIVGLRITAAAARLRATQLDLFQPNGPSALALAATIARLAALCGPDRVGRPVRLDSHREDATALGDFTGDARLADTAGNARVAATAGDVRSPATDAGPVDAVPSGGGPGANADAAPTRVALRAFRPPATLEVYESRGRLDYVRGHGFGGRVVHVGGPWRLRGEWWTADPYHREYYDVELTDGGLYRIFRDGRTGRWLADGMYD